MKHSILSLSALAMLSLVFSNCKKDEDDKPKYGELTIEFDNRAGVDDLVYGQSYTTANGDQVTFSQFDYYVSNFVLVKSDGSEVVIPKDESYFLCKHADADSREITFTNVPEGDYKSVRFIIGVDSLKSVSDVSQRTGVLDPAGAAAGMYWSWNAGYIFVKVEGTSPQAPINSGTGERTIQYHTGLFGGKDTPTLNNIKKVSITSNGELARVREGKEGPDFHVLVDLLEMFTNPANINVAVNPSSHAGAFSKTVADNYADMFQLDHVHNHD